MKTFLTTFLLWTITITCTAQWVELDPGVDVPYFSDVYAITPDIAVVVGANGTILKTTDGGETWVQKLSGTSNGLSKVQFPNPDIGYIIGGGGTLLKTIDGGETWNVIDTESDFSLSGLSCIDENLIFISTNNNALLKTEDGGENWETVISALPLLSQIQFLNNDIGFVWEQFNFNLSKTENGGETWNETMGASPIHFLNAEVGFYYDGGLLKTIDSGENFVSLGFGEAGLLYDIFAINENNVWGILPVALDGDPSTRGILKISINDTGLYDETIVWENNPNIDMSSIHFANETTGYIAGFKQGKGAIWKNGTGINVMSTKENDFKNVIKVYPNPASNEINIEIQNEFNNPSVSIADLNGRQVYSQKFSANNKITIDVKNFPKGIYILSINNHSQKIIIN